MRFDTEGNRLLLHGDRRGAIRFYRCVLKDKSSKTISVVDAHGQLATIFKRFVDASEWRYPFARRKFRYHMNKAIAFQYAGFAEIDVVYANQCYDDLNMQIGLAHVKEAVNRQRAFVAIAKTHEQFQKSIHEQIELLITLVLFRSYFFQSLGCFEESYTSIQEAYPLADELPSSRASVLRIRIARFALFDSLMLCRFRQAAELIREKIIPELQANKSEAQIQENALVGIEGLAALSKDGDTTLFSERSYARFAQIDQAATTDMLIQIRRDMLEQDRDAFSAQVGPFADAVKKSLRARIDLIKAATADRLAKLDRKQNPEPHLSTRSDFSQALLDQNDLMANGLKQMTISVNNVAITFLEGSIRDVDSWTKKRYRPPIRMTLKWIGIRVLAHVGRGFAMVILLGSGLTAVLQTVSDVLTLTDLIKLWLPSSYLPAVKDPLAKFAVDIAIGLVGLVLSDKFVDPWIQTRLASSYRRQCLTLFIDMLHSSAATIRGLVGLGSELNENSKDDLASNPRRTTHGEPIQPTNIGIVEMIESA